MNVEFGVGIGRTPTAEGVAHLAQLADELGY